MPRKPGYIYANRNAFVALLPQLREAYAEGRSLSSLHDEFKDRIGIGYIQFTRYCRRYREALGEGVPLSSLSTPPKTVDVRRHGHNPDHHPKQYQDDKSAKGFQFNPMDAITKKLI